jgi:hypothetical protein
MKKDVGCRSMETLGTEGVIMNSLNLSETEDVIFAILENDFLKGR